jgi:hypothetical protein
MMGVGWGLEEIGVDEAFVVSIFSRKIENWV